MLNKWSMMCAGFVGAVGGLVLAVDNQRKTIEAKNVRARMTSRPAGYSEISLATITNIKSISPEFGDWLLDIRLSNNPNGWYPDPEDSRWMNLQYGFTSLALLIENGRTLLLRIGEKDGISNEYPVDGRLWSAISNKMIFQTI